MKRPRLAYNGTNVLVMIIMIIARYERNKMYSADGKNDPKKIGDDGTKLEDRIITKKW